MGLFFEKNTVLAIVVCVAIGVLVSSAFLGKGVCFVCVLPLFGGVLTAAYCTGADYFATLFAVGVFFLCGGGCLFFVACIDSAVKRRAEKRNRAEERKRRLQFTLPDKDNTFVRARLHTVLQPPLALEEESAVQESVQVSYARKLLSRLLESPLSAAERLQAEDIGKTFALYQKKVGVSEVDLCGINEAFALLLKLSAKYEVAV